MFTIRVDAQELIGKFKKLNAIFPTMVDTVVAKTAFKGIEWLMELTPRKTGHARRGWGQPVQQGQNKYIIHNEVPYVGILEDGSKPHMIFPTTKKALFFRKWPAAGVPKNAKGGWAFKFVNHPGTRGRHFIKATIAGMNDFMGREFDNALKVLINNVGMK